MQRKAPRKPSMRDVAKAADVSVQTVSRVLNEKPNVSNATRARVQAAIESLNYHRNVAALSLVTSSSMTVGVIDFGQGRAGSWETIRGIQDKAYRSDYFVSIAHCNDMSASGVRRVIGSMLQQSVAGLIFVAPHHEALLTIAELELTTPFVVVGPSTKLDFLSVSVADKKASEIAITHLISLGHRRLAHLCGPLDWADSSVRMESWYSTIKRRGLPMLPTYVGDWTARSGAENALRIMEEAAPTAIFTANDQMALGLMSALQMSGYQIPNDVSVIGFGDAHDSEFYSPPLTTIREGYGDAGKLSVGLLLRLIKGAAVESVVQEPKLLVRKSTGKAENSMKRI